MEKTIGFTLGLMALAVVIALTVVCSGLILVGTVWVSSLFFELDFLTWR